MLYPTELRRHEASYCLSMEVTTLKTNKKENKAQNISMHVAGEAQKANPPTAIRAKTLPMIESTPAWDRTRDPRLTTRCPRSPPTSHQSSRD